MVLDGVISGMDPENRKVYTSAPTFPGNSGGPLIAYPSNFYPGADGIPGRFPVFLAGIMLETKLLPTQDPIKRIPSMSGYAGSAQSLPASDPINRIPSLHLGVAAPVDAVLALLDSDQAKAIIARVEGLRPG